jgi:hypothetical protein
MNNMDPPAEHRGDPLRARGRGRLRGSVLEVSFFRCISSGLTR